MVYTFDSLGYAKKLRDRGVPQEQAEAHAEAARDFIMTELLTKADFQSSIAPIERKIDKLEANIDRLDTKIENLSVRLTLRLGAMIVVAIGALATLLRLS